MGVKLSLSITQNSQNLANKTSNVTVNVTASWDYGSYNATGQCYCDLTIDGTTYKDTGIRLNPGQSKTGSAVVMTRTVNVSHNSDGTKTLSCRASFYTGLSNVGTITATGSKTLTTIYQVSTPTTNVTMAPMGATVTIYTNRASTSFTHDLAYSFAGGKYVSIATGVGASYNWTIPDLASSVPNASTGTVTIRCITKSGSTTLGTKTVTMVLAVPNTVNPSISAVTTTEATSGMAAQFGAFIQGKSAMNVAITAAGASGSTIKTYKTTLLGASYAESTFTTGLLTQAGTFNLATTVTDSRGRTASMTKQIQVLPYTLPAISEFRAFRSDANGYAKTDGTYLSVSYSYSVASCNNRNTAEMVIEYKRTVDSSWTTLATGSDLEGSGIRFFANGPTFSTDYQYDVRMRVTDWFEASTSHAVKLSSADVVLDISSDGRGLGLGKVSQRTGIEFARMMYDRFDTVITNGSAVYTGSGDTAIDPDVTLEHLVLTNKNTPTTSFWYVTTLFYTVKSATTARMQYALPYSSPSSMWTRTYYQGAWSNWVEAPAIVEKGTSGLWTYVKWSDGRVELSGSHWLYSMACTTALGSWYRTDVIQPEAFPFPVYDQNLLANYESDGYGAMLWATTLTTTTRPANYYLIRPTSATIASGKIAMRVTGRWK